MNRKLIERIQEIFFEKLQAKTGWGRLEIMAIYKEAQIQALTEFLDS